MWLFDCIHDDWRGRRSFKYGDVPVGVTILAVHWVPVWK